MFDQWLLAQRTITFALAGVVSILCVTTVQAEEQRCKDLGANCICSEPLNTNSYSLVTGTVWAWNPADSIVKECAIEGVQGGAYELGTQGTNTKSPTNSATVLSAFPSGHSVSYVLRGGDGHADLWFLGTKLTSSHPTARVAMRAYHYFSGNYGWNGGTCSNSGKLTQLGPIGMITSNSNGNYGLYSFGGNGTFSPSNPDCCSRGPGYDPGSVSAISTSNMRGKWFRTEIIVKNRSGSPGLVFQMYMKDVTNNGPEYKVIDTSIACSTADCGPGSGWISPSYTSNLAPPGGRPISDLWWDFFRNGSCSGFAAISHILVAGWSTDAGQRIGSAVEIEGGGGGGALSPPPTPPANLRVTQLMGDEW